MCTCKLNRAGGFLFSCFCQNFARNPSQLTRPVVNGCGGVDRRGGKGKQRGNNYGSEQTRRQCWRRCAVMRQLGVGARRDRVLQTGSNSSTLSLRWKGMLHHIFLTLIERRCTEVKAYLNIIFLIQNLGQMEPLCRCKQYQKLLFLSTSILS